MPAYGLLCHLTNLNQTHFNITSTWTPSTVIIHLRVVSPLSTSERAAYSTLAMYVSHNNGWNIITAETSIECQIYILFMWHLKLDFIGLIFFSFTSWIQCHLQSHKHHALIQYPPVYSLSAHPFTHSVTPRNPPPPHTHTHIQHQSMHPFNTCSPHPLIQCHPNHLVHTLPPINTCMSVNGSHRRTLLCVFAYNCSFDWVCVCMCMCCVGRQVVVDTVVCVQVCVGANAVLCIRNCVSCTSQMRFVHIVKLLISIFN